MGVNNAVRMDLCIECSPAMQEVPGSIPDGCTPRHVCLGSSVQRNVDGSGQASTVSYNEKFGDRKQSWA